MHRNAGCECKDEGYALKSRRRKRRKERGPVRVKRGWSKGDGCSRFGCSLRLKLFFCCGYTSQTGRRLTLQLFTWTNSRGMATFEFALVSTVFGKEMVFPLVLNGLLKIRAFRVSRAIYCLFDAKDIEG